MPTAFAAVAVHLNLWGRSVAIGRPTGRAGPRGPVAARHPFMSAVCTLVAVQFGSSHSMSPTNYRIGDTHYLTT